MYNYIQKRPVSASKRADVSLMHNSMSSCLCFVCVCMCVRVCVGVCV